jgi:hypothetical protein
MLPQTYPALLRALFLSPPVSVFGGFAQDALIAGTSMREHGDVDVIVWRDELQDRFVEFALPRVRSASRPWRSTSAGRPRGHRSIRRRARAGQGSARRTSGSVLRRLDR